MAVFNPQVAPTQDPNYLNYSRVIEAPAPDVSGKIALETAGAALNTGAAGVDLSIKTAITDKAYAAVDVEREKYTQGLEMIKSDLDRSALPQPPRSLLDSNAAMTDSDIDEDNLPSGLESGLGRVDRLAAAKAAGSPRLNDTQYSSEVLGIAKSLRAEYGTGYREYIDQRVSQASGLPVANSYYNNMIQDINRQLSAQAKVKDDVGSAMMKNLDVPGMPNMITRRKAGDPTMTDAHVLGKIGEWQNLQTQQKIDAATAVEGDRLDKNKVANTEQRLTSRLGNEVAFSMSGVKDLGGVGTAKDLIQYFDDAAMGKINPSAAELGQKRTMFNAWVVQEERRLASGMTAEAGVIGSDAAAKTLKNAMFPIYTMQKFVNSKEDGVAFFHAQQIEAIKNDAMHGFLINKDYGRESVQIITARSILGDVYFPEYLRSMMERGVDIKFGGILNQEAIAAIAPYTDSRGQKIPRYMKEAIQHGKAIGATGESNYFGSVTSLVEKLADDKMPQDAKDNMIDWAFNPKNVGVLDELKMDYRDKNGNIVPGKYRAFNIMTAPKITQAIAENAKVKPENYDKYKSWGEVEFARLYRQDLQTLNKTLEAAKNDVVTIEGKSSGPRIGLGFSWNDKTNEFGLTDGKGRPLTREDPKLQFLRSTGSPSAGVILGAFDVLDRVNSGVANLGVIHRLDPRGAKDTNQYILKTLQTSGFRPGEIQGANEAMQKAVIKSKNPDLTPEQLNEKVLGIPAEKRSNFAPERRTPSVSEFVRNPTGRSQLDPQQTRGVIQGNLSDSEIVGSETTAIPDGVDPMEFLRSLRKR